MSKISILSTDLKTVLSIDFYNSKAGLNCTKICVKNSKDAIIEHGFQRSEHPAAIDPKFIALFGVGKKYNDSIRAVFQSILDKIGLGDDENLLNELLETRQKLASATAKRFSEKEEEFSEQETIVLKAAKKAYIEHRAKAKKRHEEIESKKNAIVEQYLSRGEHTVKPFEGVAKLVNSDEESPVSSVPAAV